MTTTAAETTMATAAARSGRRWVIAIVALLVGNILAGIVLIAAAHHGASRVLPGYYEHAVHYDDRIDQEAQNRALAWQVAVAIDHGVATVTARDPQGAPLAGAHVRIDGSERAATALAIAAELPAGEPGEYRAQVPGTGWIDLAVTVERNGQRYIHQLAIEAR
jgi:nitrogen fixation protein FixH